MIDSHLGRQKGLFPSDVPPSVVNVTTMKGCQSLLQQTPKTFKVHVHGQHLGRSSANNIAKLGKEMFVMLGTSVKTKSETLRTPQL